MNAIQKTKEAFDLSLAQKKGAMATNHAVEYIIGALIVVILVSVLAQTIFGNLGSSGLKNATANPDVPTWLPTTLIIAVAVGLLYLVFKALGLVK